MESRIQVTEQLTIGSQPAPEELQQLQQDGFKTVVNLQVTNEQGQRIAPEEEGEQVRALGMTYLNIPVSSLQIRLEQVDEFRHAIQALEAPIFVHSRNAERAGAFAFLHKAVEQGWSSEETQKQAEQAGWACPPPMAELIKAYLER